MDRPLSGKNFLAIMAAFPEAEKKKLDLNLYQIIVIEDKGVKEEKIDSATVVIFIDVNASWPPKKRGNVGKIPSFEVKLRPDDFKIIESHFIR